MNVSNVFLGGKTRIKVYYHNTLLFETKLLPGLYKNGVRVKTWSQIETEYSTAFVTLSGSQRRLRIRADNNGNSYFTDMEGTLILDDSVYELGDYCFAGCDKLVFIFLPEGVRSIGSYAFQNSGIKSIKLPSSIREIKSNAFAYCYSLKEADMSLMDTLIYLNSFCFYNCNRLEKITLPNAPFTLSASFFAGCSSLKEIDLTNLFSQLPDYCFSNCLQLQKVIMPSGSSGVTLIGQRCFENCRSLSYISDLTKVVSINSYAFSSCNSLNLVFSNRCSSIGEGVFSNAGGKIEFQGETPPTIRGTTFSYFYGKILVPSGKISAYLDVSDNSYYQTSLYEVDRQTPGLYQNGVLIKDWDTIVEDTGGTITYYSCSYNGDYFSEPLEGELVFPDTIAIIYKLSNTNLTRIVLPYGLTNVSSYCFEENGALEEVIFRDGYTEFNLQYLFTYCSNLENIRFSIHSSAPDYPDLYHTFQSCRKIKKLSLPFVTNARNTSLIHAFTDCVSLEEVDFPNITTLDTIFLDVGFYNCNSLIRTTISDMMMNSFQVLNGWSRAFVYCYSLFSGTTSSNPLNLTIGSEGSFPILSSCHEIQYLNISGVNGNPINNSISAIENCSGLLVLNCNALTINGNTLSSINQGEEVNVQNADTIEDYAFNNSTINTVRLKSSVSISVNSFSHATISRVEFIPSGTSPTLPSIPQGAVSNYWLGNDHDVKLVFYATTTQQKTQLTSALRMLSNSTYKSYKTNLYINYNGTETQI